MRLLNALAFLLVLGLATGCNSSFIPDREGNSLLAGFSFGGGKTNSHRVSGSGGGADGSQATIRQVRGTDEFLGSSGRSIPLVSQNAPGRYSLNLVQVGIPEAAKAVLGDSLGLNYTIDPSVSGDVTLQTTQPMDQATLLETFEAILEINGATLERAGDLIKVVPISSAARRVSRLGDASAVGGRIIAVPLEYISAEEMARILTEISGSGLTMDAISDRNVLLIGGPRAEVTAAIDAINLFDVDVMEGKSIGIFQLSSADPEAIAEELVQIFDSDNGGALEGVVEFVPNPRLSSILVITSRAKYIEEARSWISQLDATASGTRRRPVVVELENRSAVELAPILTQLIAESAEQEEGVLSSSTSARVIADDTKNALIVWGNKQERDDIGRMIVALDTTPVQVLLEATIAEVTLTDELKFGLRWFFQEGRTSGTFTDVATGAVASEFPGLSFLFQSSRFNAAFNALSSVTDVNVVSSPSLIVRDNQTANLQIGDEVPVATQQSSDPSNVNAPIINTISFRDTGIILNVRPRVSSSGRVSLEIEQEVSSVKSTTSSGIDSPTISQRKIQTVVVVDDGSTLALGGLIQDNSNKTRAKVPGAGDVPLLGALFRDTDDRRERVELLILITPRVIRDGVEARQVTDEFRKRLGGPNSLIFNPGTSETTSHRILN